MTAAQRAVIDSTAPAILVSAGPGAAKTTVLVERIKRLVLDPYVSPSRIVVLTYTNAAAKVLTDRLPGAALQFTGTLHGWLLRLLTQHGQLIGLPASLSVVDADEERALLSEAVDEMAYRGTLRDLESEVAKGPAPRLNPMTKAGLAAEAFFQRLRADGVLTFDMILFYGERLLRAMQAKGRALDVDHLLCDEVQDFTAQDWRIVEASGVPNIWCCGDFDQAIFAWRSGEKTNGFEERCGLTIPRKQLTGAQPIRLAHIPFSLGKWGVVGDTGHYRVLRPDGWVNDTPVFQTELEAMLYVMSKNDPSSPRQNNQAHTPRANED